MTSKGCSNSQVFAFQVLKAIKKEQSVLKKYVAKCTGEVLLSKVVYLLPSVAYM